MTIGAPAVGNINFCRHLDDYAQPFGGIRVWNEYDIVPYIALLVGYSHAGVPIKMALPSGAKELFQKESQDSLVASALDAVSPHILYQIGPLLHVLPVMGFNSVVGAKIKGTNESKELSEITSGRGDTTSVTGAESDKDYSVGDSVDVNVGAAVQEIGAIDSVSDSNDLPIALVAVDNVEEKMNPIDNTSDSRDAPVGVSAVDNIEISVDARGRVDSEI